MILLDTNVVSEPLRPEPSQSVIDWIDAQLAETLFLSAVSVAELRAGVALMPAGKRRNALNEQLERRVLPLFTGRVLSFDLACSAAYAQLVAKTRKAGKPIGMADACIASIALANGLIVATRDVAAFEAAGVELINPWRITPTAGTPQTV